MSKATILRWFFEERLDFGVGFTCEAEHSWTWNLLLTSHSPRLLLLFINGGLLGGHSIWQFDGRFWQFVWATVPLQSSERKRREKSWQGFNSGKELPYWSPRSQAQFPYRPLHIYIFFFVFLHVCLLPISIFKNFRVMLFLWIVIPRRCCFLYMATFSFQLRPSCSIWEI